MQATILNYNPTSNAAQQDDSDAALLLHLASSTAVSRDSRGVVAAAAEIRETEDLDCKPAAKATPVSVYDDTPTVTMQDSVSSAAARQEANSACRWVVSPEAFASPSADKPYHDTDVIVEDSTATTTVPTHHQDNDNDEVMQAIRDLQCLRSSVESLQEEPFIVTTTAGLKDPPKTQQGMYCSCRLEEFVSSPSCKSTPQKYTSHTFFFSCPYKIATKPRKTKELENLQEVWFLNEGSTRRKRKRNIQDDDNDNDDDDTMDYLIYDATTTTPTLKAPPPAAAHAKEITPPAKKRHVRTETAGNDMHNNNTNQALAFNGDIRSSMQALQVPVPTGAVIDLVETKYQNNVFCLLQDLERQVVETDLTTANAYKFSAQYCPRGKSTLWRICCQLNGHERVELSAWWRHCVAAYQSHKSAGTLMEVLERRNHDDDDQKPRARAKQESTTTAAHDDAVVPVPQPIPGMPEERDSLGSTSSIVSLLDERTKIQPHPNTEEYPKVASSLATTHLFLSLCKRLLVSTPDDLIPWKHAVVLSVLVFLAMCGPVALMLTLYVHFVPQSTAVPETMSQCYMMPDPSPILFQS